MRGRGLLSVSVSEQLFVSPAEKEEEKEKAAEVVGPQGKQKVGKIYEDEEEDYFNAPEVSVPSYFFLTYTPH
jgi:hypothetical protein